MSKNETLVSSVTLRKKQQPGIWPQLDQDVHKRSPLLQPDAFMKNLGIASALVLCAVTLRTGAIPALDPAADVVMTAATDHSLLDDQLGKLSFVSALFPEAVLVFGENAVPTLLNPTDTEQITHAWSEQEPYVAWSSSGGVVISSASGEVTGIYHGNGGERIVHVLNDNGLTCLYGNLEEVSVQTGDAVTVGQSIGKLPPDGNFVFEVRKNGISVDPTKYLVQ